jgi:hypothetical protein
VGEPAAGEPVGAVAADALVVGVAALIAAAVVTAVGGIGAVDDAHRFPFLISSRICRRATVMRISVEAMDPRRKQMT